MYPLDKLINRHNRYYCCLKDEHRLTNDSALRICATIYYAVAPEHDTNALRTSEQRLQVCLSTLAPEERLIALEISGINEWATRIYKWAQCGVFHPFRVYRNILEAKNNGRESA